MFTPHILFGPPGTGKTTLIRTVRESNSTVNSIELEPLQLTIHNGNLKEKRASLLACFSDFNFDCPFITTAADLELNQIPNNFKLVLLWPEDADQYDTRTKKRDEEQNRPHQNHMQFYKLMKEHVLPNINFDQHMKIDTLAHSIEECSNIILGSLLEEV